MPRLIVLAAAAVGCAGSLWGVDPYRTMSQYVRDRWGIERGFPQGPVYSIAQASDGYLWIGTEKGLVRFDGLSFQLTQSAAPEQSSLSHVLGVSGASGGGLWLRLRRPGLTLLRYHNRVFSNPMGDLATVASISAMARGRDGGVLFCLLEGRTSDIVIRDEKFTTLAAPAGLSRAAVLAIAQTSGGEIWVGTSDAGLFRIRGGEAVAITEGLPDLKVNTLAAFGNNELWVGTDGGLVRWDGKKLTNDGVPRALGRTQVLAMTLDRNSNLWLGTNTRGLLRVNARGVSWMEESPERAKEAVTAVFEDREGSLWAGRASSLERIRDSVFVSYSSAEGLPSDRAGPIYADEENRIWFAPMSGGLSWLREGGLEQVKIAGLDGDVVYSIAGGKDGLWIGRQRGGLTQLRRQGGSFAATTFTTKEGLAQDSVYAVSESRDGSVWAGTLSGGVSKLQDGRITSYAKGDGLASDTVTSILGASDGAMWFATPEGLSTFSNGRWKTYMAADGLPSDEVTCLLEDVEGVLWIGTSSGLAFHKAGRIGAPAAAPASLREEQILGLARDGSGSLWIATATHILRAKRDKLLSGRLSDGEVREYGTADGLRGIEGVKRHQSVVKDSLGRIWFSTNRGLSVVHPDLLTGSAAPTIVHVQSISADGSGIAMGDAVRIPPGRRRLTLRFAGLSLAVPDQVRFRYRLDGFDPGWSEPTAAREAVYTNLGPGPYTFRVIASNADGVWNSAEESLPFNVEPAVWETWWFQISGVLTCLLGVAALYRFRVDQVTRQLNVRFEERLAERTRIAQELHDTLVQGFLSASMQLHVAAEKVPEDSPAKPQLSRVLQLMGQVVEEGRNAVRGLRSQGGAGDLEVTISRIEQEFAGNEQTSYRVIVEGRKQVLHPILRDEVYRIGREAVVNAFRHAHAKNIEVEIEYGPKRFRLLVRDDGRGINPDILNSGREGHWGLPGMRERAERIGGRLSVWSRTSSGTEVELYVPGHIAFELQTASLRQRLSRLLTR